MGLFDRMSRVVQANLNDLASQTKDPEKILDDSIMEMQEYLLQLRQGVAQAIAVQKRIAQQMIAAENNANEYLRKAKLAAQKGYDNLARQGLQRKKTYLEKALTLKQYLDQQKATVETLKHNIQVLEQKIAEAKTKQNIFNERINEAKKQELSKELQGKLEAKLKVLEDAANALNDKFFLSTEEGTVQVTVQVKIEVTVTGLEKTRKEPFPLLNEDTLFYDELENLRRELSQM